MFESATRHNQGQIVQLNHAIMHNYYCAILDDEFLWSPGQKVQLTLVLHIFLGYVALKRLIIEYLWVYSTLPLVLFINFRINTVIQAYVPRICK